MSANINQIKSLDSYLEAVRDVCRNHLDTLQPRFFHCFNHSPEHEQAQSMMRVINAFNPEEDNRDELFWDIDSCASPSTSPLHNEFDELRTPLFLNYPDYEASYQRYIEEKTQILEDSLAAVGLI